MAPLWRAMTGRDFLYIKECLTFHIQNPIIRLTYRFLSGTILARRDPVIVNEPDLVFMESYLEIQGRGGYHFNAPLVLLEKWAKFRNGDDDGMKHIVNEFDSDLEAILEKDEESEQEELASSPVTTPLVTITKEDVAGEISFWSTSVYCYVLGANPPSNVLTGFAKRVWQAQGIDKISFLPNGIFLVRFKTKEQQQFVLNNGHLMFDNKPVIVNEWTPETELIKHDVQKIPIWMKLFGLDVKYWGQESLKKLSGVVGKFIKCDDATFHKNFLGFARIMIEVAIDQQFPTKIQFVDEHGKVQSLKVVYDWIPLTCTSCKGMGHLTEKCRKGTEPVVGKKVWRPKKAPAKPGPGPQPKPAPKVQRAVVQQTGVPAVTVVAKTPAPVIALTPVLVQQTPNVGSSMPRRFMAKLMRTETGEKRRFTHGGLSFMESLTHSLQHSRLGIGTGPFERGEGSKIGETKVKVKNWENVRINICDDWSICSNTSLHKGGRIWLIWNPNYFEVDVCDITVQCIHTKVRDKIRKNSFWFTVVYGLNQAADREDLWSRLRCYQRVVQDCQLDDLSARGAFYTWSNKHEDGEKIYSRIDRVLINDDWAIMFSDSYVHFLPEGMFDHCPCLINFDGSVQRKGAPFKYFNMWSMAPDYPDIVKKGWNLVCHGTAMFKVVTKLKGLKYQLKKLDKDQFGDIVNLRHVAELSLKQAQEMLVGDPLNEDLCKIERICAKEVEELRKERDQFLSQKAKCDWLKHGDDNTSYFHACIRRRRAKNRVFQVADVNNVLCSTTESIQAAFIHYYQQLLGTEKYVKPINRKVIKYGKCVTEAHCLMLSAPITTEEVKVAMFDIPGTKAPGPDVQGAIHSGKLLKQCNATTITLIPKVPLPETVLCNRIGKVLPDIISPSQGAFIKGRDIVGNILICQDLIKLYKRKSCSPRVLMKVDLQKAYDSVAWSFVLEMIQATGFLESFTKIIMQCITTPTYSLSLNGETFGFFKGRRGLRGDRGSVGLMLAAFDHFSTASGLEMNNGKSNFYYNGIDESLVSKLRSDYKIVDKIRSLGSRKLSYAGRVVLIKSVLSSLHCYWARIFILPKTVISKIEAVCRSFLWYGSNYKESPALVSWATICQPRKQGGLGFKDLHAWNVAAIAKYVWWIAMKADHLWVRWVHAVYIKTETWKDYEPGTGSSWAWRKICQVKNIYKSKLFTDPTVEQYSLKEGYHWLKPVGDKVQWYPWMLNRMIIPRHVFMCWLVAQNRLLTQDRLLKMNIIQNNCCYLCGETMECHEHLFFQCRYSRLCLELTGCWSLVDLPEKNCIEWWIRWRQQSIWFKQAVAMILASLLAHIWFARNKCRFEGCLSHPQVVVNSIKREVKWRINQYEVPCRNGRVRNWVNYISSH
ncbi:uncharacterized protein LOC141649113 [Silene latifolia]|uniref:uncharacterized protein LOC141649113 n=1 Tax=Silene latifolia TaxID=37657 RepID=UPI003D785248